MGFPEISFMALTNVTQNSVTLNASIVSYDSPTYVTFEYGTSTTYSNSSPASQNPVSGNTPVNVSTNISSLLSGTIYHLRIKAENSYGISYSNDTTFITCPLDIDGNIYPTIKIGNQIWIASNIKTRHYRDGSIIQKVEDQSVWDSQTSGALCIFNNDSITFYNNLGYLYNWYAVTDTRGLCPTGWHVPSNSDWNNLITYLGGTDVAGGKLKEIGTTHWSSPNTEATNISGFTARGGGYRSVFVLVPGQFAGLQLYGFWWSTNQSGDNAYKLRLQWDNGKTYFVASVPKTMGYSVRCIKD
jgi:uncharacterized protein (TIGR02145 family)